MTSVNTNIAATTALRTLQQTNSALDTTQSRISTGLKIGEAKDNAAYWSISTSLRSDNKAMGTVKDALGLGAATVDTAYQGLNESLAVLDEIKSKLTAATQPGVDKSKIQSEIKQLQEQLKSIAGSSSLSGENWLAINSDMTGFSPTKSVVSSFTREGSSVSIGTIDIDISSFALTNASVRGEGILDGGKVGNEETGGLENRALVSGLAATSGRVTQAAAFVYTAGTASTDTFAATITIDSQAYIISTVTGSTAFDTESEMLGLLNAAIGSNGTARLNADGYIEIVSATTGTSSNVTLDVTFTGGSATGLGDLSIDSGDAGTSAVTTMTGAFTDPFTLDANDTMSFTISANGQPAKVVVIDRNTINKALGEGVNGRVGTVAQFDSVVTRALADAGVANISVDVSSNRIRLTSDLAGADSTIKIENFSANKGVSILAMDVASASREQINTFVVNVNTAMDKITTAAANLGAVAARIELQQSFVTNLMDTIDSGISGLVDADMNEESTRLQALQVKQQLGVQALSIANQSAQNVLRLFQ